MNGLIGFSRIESEKKRKEMIKHLICRTPNLMHKTLMLIYGGVHCVNSLIESFEDYETDHFIGQAATQLTSDLKTGMPVAGAVRHFNTAVQYKPLGKMLQRLVLYDQTGNSLVLEQLKSDLSQLNDEKYTYLIQQINQSDLISMLPSMVHLLLMILLLMSPIFLGGMQL